MVDKPVNTNAIQEQIDALLARAGEDPALHRRVLSDPERAVRDAGIVLPPGVTLHVRQGDGVPAVTVEKLGE